VARTTWRKGLVHPCHRLLDYGFNKNLLPEQLTLKAQSLLDVTHNLAFKNAKFRPNHVFVLQPGHTKQRLIP
jgi:hypothetical protein